MITWIRQSIESRYKGTYAEKSNNGTLCILTNFSDETGLYPIFAVRMGSKMSYMSGINPEKWDDFKWKNIISPRNAMVDIIIHKRFEKDMLELYDCYANMSELLSAKLKNFAVSKYNTISVSSIPFNWIFNISSGDKNVTVVVTTTSGVWIVKTGSETNTTSSCYGIIDVIAQYLDK